MDEPLSRLAGAAGIEARYWDIQGHLHETSPETARLLLGVLGFPAATEEEVAESLVRLEKEVWRETLPPVIIALMGNEIVVPLRLPALDSRHLSWSLDLEDGGQVRGEVVIDDLAVEATGKVDGTPLFLRQLRLPAQPSGYHRFRVEGYPATHLVVAPHRCYLPPDGRYWGIAAQLYAVRSEHNWGMGDFTDLHMLVDWAAARGAAMVGVNPLHALFLDTPADASPYFPSSRLFLNPLYLDVAAIPDFAELEEASRPNCANVGVREGDMVDYSGVACAKLAAVERLFAHFRTAHSGDSDHRGSEFREFVAQGGSDLYSFTTFQMLSEHFGTHDWSRWPQSSQKPNSDETFSSEQTHRIVFFQYLQWQCAVQMSVVAEQAKAMTIGVYNDLAVSVADASADHWAHQDSFLQGVQIGAPPDPFNEAGQSWGLTPFNPRRLRATGYVHFIALLRANMRHAGALRIDHVMGWQRLFLIPSGASASEGAYLRFPLNDLLAIAALESQRNQCVLIGEDLGTVPAGFRERMAAANVLSCRILYFERDGDCFRRPREFPKLAAVSATTHDLATLRGYWAGEDIAAKAHLGILTDDDASKLRDDRARDKRLLVQALVDESLIQGLGEDAPWSPQLAAAIQAYLARSRSLLFMVQLDDLASEIRQVNLPGSTADYPNWRRRLGRSLQEMTSDPEISQMIAAIAGERGGNDGLTI
jgi:4-alpha-glucanotransferase